VRPVESQITAKPHFGAESSALISFRNREVGLTGSVGIFSVQLMPVKDVTVELRCAAQQHQRTSKG